MNATELYLKDGRSAGIWYCEKCRIVSKDKETAEKCCAPWHCKTCGEECERYRMLCRECRDAEANEQWHQMLAEAEEIPSDEYDGPWYYEGYGDDGFLWDDSRLFEECEENGEQPPEFVFCCNANVFTVDVRDIIEDAEAHLEIDNCDGYAPDYNGLDEFKAACQKFTEANKHIKTYWPDSKRKVRVWRKES